MKKLTRRVFLKVLAALGLSSLLPGVSLASSSRTPVFTNMDALADVLVPGLKDLGIDEKIRETILKNTDTARICFSGLEAVENYSTSTYGKSFHELAEKEKEAVLKWMDEMPKEGLAGFFFKKFRETVLALYYTSPEVWKRLKYDGPPQPRGFMDYHLPPGGVNE